MLNYIRTKCCSERNSLVHFHFAQIGHYHFAPTQVENLVDFVVNLHSRASPPG